MADAMPARNGNIGNIANWAGERYFQSGQNLSALPLLGDIQFATINGLWGTGPKWGRACNGNAAEHHREHSEVEGSAHVSVTVLCLVTSSEGSMQRVERDTYKRLAWILYERVEKRTASLEGRELDGPYFRSLPG